MHPNPTLLHSLIAVRRGTRRVTHCLSILLFAALGLVTASRSQAVTPPAEPAFQLTSEDLRNDGRLPEAQVLNGFGRHGGNISPHLAWDHVPAGAKSFVVTMFDPDAPTGSGWWHWVVIDLPASARGLARGSGTGAAPLPAGARQVRTDFGKPGYGGAAPPAGETHRYVFTIHALDVERLDVDADASAALIGFLTHAHSLGRATLTVTYGP